MKAQQTDSTAPLKDTPPFKELITTLNNATAEDKAAFIARLSYENGDRSSLDNIHRELVMKERQLTESLNRIKIDYRHISEDLISRTKQIQDRLTGEAEEPEMPSEVKRELNQSKKEISELSEELETLYEGCLSHTTDYIETVNQGLTKTNFEINRLTISRFFPFFIKHWQFFSGMTYLLICIVGMVSSWRYYGKFGINFLDYAVITDFFISGISNSHFPSTLAFAAVFTVFLLSIFVIRNTKNSYAIQLSGKFFLTKTCWVIIILAASSLSVFQAQVKNGNSPVYSIYNSFPIDDLHHVRLIGTTSEYAFFVPGDALDHEPAFIIPKSKILAMAAGKSGSPELASTAITKSSPYQQISDSISKIGKLRAEFDPVLQVVMTENEPPESQDIRELIQKYIEQVINTELERDDSHNHSGEYNVSRPICFRPKLSYIEEKYKKSCIEKISHFMSNAPGNALIYVIGLSSPEGSDAHNMKLSEERANHIQEIIAGHYPNQTHVIAMGETHTLNGISDSRSVYLAYRKTPSPPQPPMAMMSVGDQSN